MIAKYTIPGLIASCSIFAVFSCGDEHKSDDVQFTKLDSVTEQYLNLKDSMLEVWNAMINDDNQKLKAMHNLLHELKVSDPSKQAQYKSYDERLEQLVQSRYTQKSMQNENVIEEYDFASNSLVSELVTLAEAQKQFAYNTTMQKLVETIRTSDQRVDSYRMEYDRVASEYNQFIDRNRPMLKEIDQDTLLEKKPLFQMADN
jgi:hypothetical protein